MLVKYIQSILELNWYQRFGANKEKLKTWKFIIVCTRRPYNYKTDHFTIRLANAVLANNGCDFCNQLTDVRAKERMLVAFMQDNTII